MKKNYLISSFILTVFLVFGSINILKLNVNIYSKKEVFHLGGLFNNVIFASSMATFIVFTCIAIIGTSSLFYDYFEEKKEKKDKIDNNRKEIANRKIDRLYVTNYFTNNSIPKHESLTFLKADTDEIITLYCDKENYLTHKKEIIECVKIAKKYKKLLKEKQQLLKESDKAIVNPTYTYFNGF